MTTLLLSLILASFTGPSHAFAGADSSGGGEAIVCFDDSSIPEEIRKNGGVLADKYVSKDGNDHITMIKSADLYDAEEPTGWDSPRMPEIIQVASPTETPTEYGKRIAARFARYVPYISDMIWDGISAFGNSKSIHPKPHGLKKIDDAKQFGILDDTCVAVQLAAQVNSSSSYGTLYLDSRLWWHPKHSALSRAVLGLHEFVYRRALKLGQTDSHNTRMLVGFLIKKNTGHTIPILIEQLASLGFTPDRRALSYRGTLVEETSRKLLDVARTIMQANVDDFTPKYFAEANAALLPYNKSCELAYNLKSLYACFDIVTGIKGLSPLTDKFHHFLEDNINAINKKVRLAYFGSTDANDVDYAARTQLLNKAKGVFNDEQLKLLDEELMQAAVIDKIPFLSYRADNESGKIPLLDSPVEKLARDFADKTELAAPQTLVVIP